MKNKSKKQLYETIMKQISKIVKQHLNENILDDFYEDDDIEKSTLMDDYIKNRKLVDCTIPEEVKDYIIDKINLQDICNNIIRICQTYNKTKTVIDDLSKGIYINDWLYAIYYHQVGSVEKIRFDIRLNKLLTELSPIEIYCNVTKGTFSITYLGDDYSIDYDTLFNKISKYLNSIFQFDRIAEELTCTPKIYKVTQKDIDRMDKCIYTRDYSGFDKITKSDKMVARLAALLIVGEKKYGWEPLKINDETLLRLFSKNKNSQHLTTNNHFYGRYHKSNVSVFRVFDRIRLFPNIHIADVLATYEKYKNEF